MKKGKYIKSLFIFLSIIALSIIPYYNMVVVGPYKWHVTTPEFRQGGIEIILAMLIGYFGFLINKKKPLIPACFCALVYLSINGVIIPTITAMIYLISILYIGYTGYFLFIKKDKDNNNLLIKSFIFGISIWGFGAIILSLLKIGTTVGLRKYTIILFVLSFILKSIKNNKFEIGKYLTNLNKFEMRKTTGAFLFLILGVFLFLCAKTNTAQDYDSLWYGLRTQYALIGEHSFYDDLGYFSFVYYYPKLLELFLAPLSDLLDYSFILCANIIIYGITNIIIFKYIKKNITAFGKKSCFNVIVACLIASIPAYANISVTAKGDILGLFLTISAFILWEQYKEDKKMSNLIFSMCALLLSTTTRLTYLLWGGILFVFEILYLLFEKNEKKFQKIFKAILNNLWLVIPATFTFLGIHYRTFKLTGYFIYPITIELWNKIFNNYHGLFLMTNATNSYPFSFKLLIERLEKAILSPSSLTHIIMLWISNILISAFIIWLCNKKKKISKLNVAYIIINLFSILYFLTTQTNPDGNYFIYPIIVISLLIFKNI